MSRIGMNNRSKVVNAEDVQPHESEAVMNAIESVGDDELREQTHTELAPCSTRAFFTRYAELHEGKYGVPIAVT